MSIVGQSLNSIRRLVTRSKSIIFIPSVLHYLGMHSDFRQKYD